MAKSYLDFKNRLFERMECNILFAWLAMPFDLVKQRAADRNLGDNILVAKRQVWRLDLLNESMPESSPFKLLERLRSGSLSENDWAELGVFFLATAKPIDLDTEARQLKKDLLKSLPVSSASASELDLFRRCTELYRSSDQRVQADSIESKRRAHLASIAKEQFYRSDHKGEPILNKNTRRLISNDKLLEPKDMVDSLHDVLSCAAKFQNKCLEEGKVPDSNCAWNLLTTGSLAGFNRSKLNASKRWFDEMVADLALLRAAYEEPVYQGRNIKQLRQEISLLVAKRSAYLNRYQQNIYNFKATLSGMGIEKLKTLELPVQGVPSTLIPYYHELSSEKNVLNSVEKLVEKSKDAYRKASARKVLSAEEQAELLQSIFERNKKAYLDSKSGAFFEYIEEISPGIDPQILHTLIEDFTNHTQPIKSKEDFTQRLLDVFPAGQFDQCLSGGLYLKLYEMYQIKKWSNDQNVLLRDGQLNRQNHLSDLSGDLCIVQSLLKKLDVKERSEAERLNELPDPYEKALRELNKELCAAESAQRLYHGEQKNLSQIYHDVIERIRDCNTKSFVNLKGERELIEGLQKNMAKKDGQLNAQDQVYRQYNVSGSEEMLPEYEATYTHKIRIYAESDREVTKNTRDYGRSYPFGVNYASLERYKEAKLPKNEAVRHMFGSIEQLARSVKSDNNLDHLLEKHKEYVRSGFWRSLFTFRSTWTKRAINEQRKLTQLDFHLKRANELYQTNGPKALVALWRNTIPEWLSSLKKPSCINADLISALEKECAKYQKYDQVDLIMPEKQRRQREGGLKGIRPVGGCVHQPSVQVDERQIDSVWDNVCAYAASNNFHAKNPQLFAKHLQKLRQNGLSYQTYIRYLNAKDQAKRAYAIECGDKAYYTAFVQNNQRLAVEYGGTYMPVRGREDWPLDNPHRYYSNHPSLAPIARAYTDRIAEGVSAAQLKSEFGFIFRTLPGMEERDEKDVKRYFLTKAETKAHLGKKYKFHKHGASVIFNRRHAGRFSDTEIVRTYQNQLENCLRSTHNCNPQTGQIYMQNALSEFRRVLSQYIVSREVKVKVHEQHGYYSAQQQVGHIHLNTTKVNIVSAKALLDAIDSACKPLLTHYGSHEAIPEPFLSRALEKAFNTRKFEKQISKGELGAMVKSMRQFIQETNAFFESHEASSVSSSEGDTTGVLSATVSPHKALMFAPSSDQRVAPSPRQVSRRRSVGPSTVLRPRTHTPLSQLETEPPGLRASPMSVC